MSTPFPPSDHFDGKHFFTPGASRIAKFRDVAKWRLGKNSAPRAVWPEWIEITPRALPSPPVAGSDAAAIVATWINHSTFLLQTAGANILFDPVFSRRCGPFGKTGPARVHAPGIALDALPRIDIVCLSHDHCDHCDLPSLRQIARRGREHDAQNPPVGITPLGNGALLRRAGFAPERIIELDWWQACELDTSAPNTKWSGSSQSKIENSYHPHPRATLEQAPRQRAQPPALGRIFHHVSSGIRLIGRIRPIGLIGLIRSLRPFGSFGLFCSRRVFRGRHRLSRDAISRHCRAPRRARFGDAAHRGV